MAMLAIRNLDDDLEEQHGLSIEEEVRCNPQKDFGMRVHQRVMVLTGGVDFPLPMRSSPRAAPDFAGGQA